VRRGHYGSSSRRHSYTPRTSDRDESEVLAAELPPPRRGKRVPFGYVLIGVSMYCALAWVVLATGVKAGLHALHMGPDIIAARDELPASIDAKE
jgi:hypothetical protein